MAIEEKTTPFIIKEASDNDLDMESLGRDLNENLFYYLGKSPLVATLQDIYHAFALTVRKRLLQRWINTSMAYVKQKVKVVCYFSAEYLPGPHLGNNLLNLGIFPTISQAFARVGANLDYFLDQEEEPGLGNGGLGRLAACYLDSLATLEIPAIGYGLRYEFGIFDQEIRDGWQAEITDKWLQWDNPWEIHHPEIAYEVKLGGCCQTHPDRDGRLVVHWHPERVVKGVAYDTPILGYNVNTCNVLRLWKAEAIESFDFQAFNKGDYYDAVDEKLVSENLTKVLYPNDEPFEGKKLRLEQQYFLCSCALQDMIRLHLHFAPNLGDFHESWAVQLNDTHPAISVVELMRLLVDERQIPWDQAWDTTRKVFSYTNHTLLPEALEKWPLPLFAQVLPRHLEIIFEINRRFLDSVRLRYPGDNSKAARLSLIDESGDRYVRMAHLACVGSHAINGVSALHTELLKSSTLQDFFELWPEKFYNITNGVTPRRFLALSNPRLTALINSKIGSDWIKDLYKLRQLEEFAEDPDFQQSWREVKLANKRQLANAIKARTGISVDPQSMFDIQVKRLHEYKRQHLNVLHIITLYLRLKKDPTLEITPRTIIFGGKAAPGYFMARLIIKLISSVAEVVNRDPDVNDRLKVVFFPNFNVKNAQKIYPAADLSQQISTAGKEASGTGNMKFALNGALTIGTLDGANVEIREEVGPENFFLFGHTVEEVQYIKAQGYNPYLYYQSNEHLREVIDLLRSGFFAHGDRDLFRPLVESLLYQDDYLLMADYQSYIERQDEAGMTFLDKKRWTRMSILNTARMGKFSSDRAIQEYCQHIWQVKPTFIELQDITLEQVRLNI
ncbi:glycogen/starch/alpha-glucan phosphorylase [Desulfobacca acetoxidans]|uniref:Alpha-1,4 glucan phosphorylase n=1 Tax=Desulfobacca acetoxidans (strain ATCC 700848 / DSM 11109 / ASRB2) TaxID=880072 RepID=F2NE76_DESAR|nr:glycogen/starch/alpha-glucan phosphorylase [Desulfobacca acetoxidans]AEB10706.1 glycogen/starch/alpha-glucan phosphorylase [Desulfobacca acetoxidans DSM 11109]